MQWTSAGVSELEGLPPTDRYRSVAFSPNGGALWGTPSSGDEDSAWDSSDVLDLASGTVSSGPRWDTGVAEHPAGGLVATLASDQGATLRLFGRVEHEKVPTAMRVPDRALILDCDGYETPIFSADGRHLAIRGNAYDNSLEIFAFPSLHRVLATTLGEPSPGYPYPPGWLDQMRAWTLVEVDLETQHTVEHDVLAGSPVSALGAMVTDDLVVAGGGGDLALVSVRAGSAKTQSADGDTSRAAVAEFLDATSEVPDDGDLETHLVVTDGARTWEAEDLAAVTTATATDPTWLQIQASLNDPGDQAK
ncbi:hypothetical protein RB628_01015 [Streptomyces sp. ADMS]|uniref:hypothetical protein n=1 Tax=Streptomyces sp. ADMS TaxID=3071415 RepID=UPI00296E8DC8|nr:hypothetical protein [Streptomyces sp. ADMS]MDW4903959.1 hypothetical protein [Streptomyces sp. ADMS]